MNKYNCGDTYDSNFPADEWEQEEAQLNYWADLDREYWRQRKESAYRLFLERKYGVIAQ